MLGCFLNSEFRLLDLRGRSSVGRAPALQAGGRRFDSDRLHHPSLFELRVASHPEIVRRRRARRSFSEGGWLVTEAP